MVSTCYSRRQSKRYAIVFPIPFDSIDVQEAAITNLFELYQNFNGRKLLFDSYSWLSLDEYNSIQPFSTYLDSQILFSSQKVSTFYNL